MGPGQVWGHAICNFQWGRQLQIACPHTRLSADTCWEAPSLSRSLQAQSRQQPFGGQPPLPTALVLQRMICQNPWRPRDNQQLLAIKLEPNIFQCGHKMTKWNSKFHNWAYGHTGLYQTGETLWYIAVLTLEGASPKTQDYQPMSHNITYARPSATPRQWWLTQQACTQTDLIDAYAEGFALKSIGTAYAKGLKELMPGLMPPSEYQTQGFAYATQS